ncbi:A disintegrin and metalloproteinase with thrombospondin motifs 12 isoform X1 [Pantherophis guttatus]|uniref:A disintegrin and metalloproteinase with thrombospondin motifs 12 isoform X1 n=2 Tax=Pantherophis guttatus TaxID=94885 RepID=A0A6P9DRA6_PANGU|nr:A disintegrin and metalloproteinase with thrombospondin motifs 12 isoform X1 [Pantherophis guttatus]
MSCTQRTWIANFSFWVHLLSIQAFCYARNPPPGRFVFPDQKQDQFVKALEDYQVVSPERVDGDGHFLSYHLHLHASNFRGKRDSRRRDSKAYYKIRHKNKDLFFDLTLHRELLSNNYVLEKRYGNYLGAKITPSVATSCHLLGTVMDSDSWSGTAAISTCNGLTGYFHLPDGDYFIEPVKKYESREGAHPHLIYKTNDVQKTLPKQQDSWTDKRRNCGVNETSIFFKQQELRRMKWERNRVTPRTTYRRSVSRERWVETLVVADSKMIEYHGSENVESYILTIINMVAGLFHDPSIGNAIHIVLVRLILLEEEEQGLKITHHAEKTLASFCKWQKSINPKLDTNPLHHDVAVLLTRKDICASMNQPCETLGLSHLSGMCQPHRSCNINEDSGLPLAFTIAHELGHSFGIQHDGKENDCEPVGRRPYIMSRQLQYDPTPLTWSRCSKEYITRFLDQGWGFCLDDVPKKKDLKPPFIAPGVIYDVHHQCQLQYGPNATYCDQVDNICQTLWCFVKGSCRSKLDAAADGTRCGENKWCFSGECITVGKSPEAINGAWGSWSPWSHCTRTCGAGIQAAERHCNNPEPQFGGKYCTGERKHYRMCNVKACQKSTPNFRQMQCSEFDTVAYKNEFYQWIPIYNTANPCELQCLPTNHHFSERMLDAVIDGTPCFEGNSYRDVCINGMCKTVGCDYEINSNATEDQCGVCLGDGSSCQTVKITFNQSQGLGYVDIGLIPKGARHIKVVEVSEAGNFLALRSEDPQKYYLNGGFIIQWNGNYKVAGTIFQYERKGDLENLTASGPTNESLWLQLLFQENNPGIKYEYTVRKSSSLENEVEEPEYIWKYGKWTSCSVTCGNGFQRQIAHCVKKGKSMVKNLFCDPETQPKAKQKKCIEKDCPPRWWAGEWQKCSSTCGPTGEKKRTVLCIQKLGFDEQALPAEECQHLLKPKTRLSCNRDVLCPSDWTVSNWTECTVTCGGGVRTRYVTCTKNNGEPCDVSKKPHSKALCGLQQCLSTQRLLMTRFKFHNGKIIRRIGAIPRRGPSKKLATPEPLPRIPSTIIPRLRNITLIPTSISLVNSSPNEDLEVKKLQNNSIHSSMPSNYSGVTSANRALQNITHGVLLTAWNISSEDSSINKDSFTIDPMYNPKTNYLMEANDTTPNSTEGEIKDYIQTERPTERFLTFTTSKVSRTSSTDDQSNNLNPFSVTPTRGTEVSLTTTDLKGLRVQINSPVTSDPITEQPTIENKLEEKSADTTPSKPSFSETIPWATESPFVRDTTMPKNSENVFKTRLLNDSDSYSKSRNVHINAYWLVGNWTECSTTCGVGAFWRPVECNTKNESDCQHIKKPDPARRCHFRPCAQWRIGNWSKCSSSCGGGFKTRDAHCIDVREKRILRPFHCQAVQSQPVLNMSCNMDPCFMWHTESWNECSASCGGGTQKRAVQCIRVDDPATKEENRCERETRPPDSQKCNLQKCVENTGSSCSKDRLSVNFCEKVRDIGKCSAPSVRIQCCQTCKRSLAVNAMGRNEN